MFDFRVNNFRSFLNQKFHFSRINILIGENSAGKSSLLKLFLALKQTIDNPTELNLKLSGDFVDLGNYEEVVYYKKKNKKITLGFEAGEKYHKYFLSEFLLTISEKDEQLALKNSKEFDKYKNSVTQVNFEFNSKLDDHTSIKTVVTNNEIGKLEILHNHAKDEMSLRQFPVDLKFTFNETEGFIEKAFAFKEGFFTLLTPELKKDCVEKFGKNGSDVFNRLSYMLIIQNYVQDEIEKIRFVNPIGTSPKRFYLKEDKKSNYKSIDIEKLINILGDQTLTKQTYIERIEMLNKTIREFGIAEEIEIKTEKNLPVIALNVKTKDYWSNITDVGYGVSLQLPILFQAILSEKYTKKGQTLLIEQPEVHLHPSLQAKFIETLIGLGSKNSYFIETHSEHIVRKLQVLIKSKKYNLKPEDVTIHYFKREAAKFVITSHNISENGILNPGFPSGFYDTSYSLVKELL